jgi:uncharacterized protein (TIGR00299 family) protein
VTPGGPGGSDTRGAPLVAAFDCFSGIAGDMALAALVDAGASLQSVREGLEGLALPPFEIACQRVRRGGLDALHLEVRTAAERSYRPGEMRAMVEGARLPPRAAARALDAIDRLTRAEAAVHGSPEARFHEVGGVDALVDICGTMLALEDLGVADARCPIVTVGAGTIAQAAHGPIPAAPGPAAARILQEAGFALRFAESAHELVTPTGAAILAAVARPGPATFVPLAHGYGAGSFDPPGRPNALRVWLGAAASPESAPPEALLRELVLLEANIDDMSAALLAHARDRLLEEGALDAWLEPIGMKKGRAASKLCALAPAADEERFAGLFLRETATLGVRVTPYRRYEAARRVETFDSSLGPVRVKVSEWAGRVRAVPEFEDVRALSASTGLPALEVHRRLEAEWEVKSEEWKVLSAEC